MACLRNKKVLGISVLIALIFFSSVLIQISVAATATFGNTQIGQFKDTLLPGYKDSCRYQAPQAGTINSISMYIQTGNAQVRFGVYSDNNGKPSQLLAQSGQVGTGSGGSWVTAGLSASVVGGQYYWLTVTSTATINYNYNYASGASAGYAKEPTTTMSTTYGTFTPWTNAKFSIYATYTSTTTTTTTTSAPTATPKPAPTATPTPAPTSSNNLVVLPGSFMTDINAASSSYASVDYSVTHNGHPSIKLTADYVRGTREVNSIWASVHPGDHIVWKVWCKTSSGVTNTDYTGGRIGVDLVTNLGYRLSTCDGLPHGYSYIGGQLRSGNLPTSHYTGSKPETSLGNPLVSTFKLPFGRDWTLLTLDFIVPSTSYTVDLSGTVSYGSAKQIMYAAPWIDARELTSGTVWFADSAFYINP